VQKIQKDATTVYSFDKIVTIPYKFDSWQYMAVEIHLSDMEKGEFETLKAEHFELYQLINKFEPLQVAALEKSTSKPMGRLVVRQGKMQKRLRNDWSLVDFVEADLKINLAIGLDYTLPDGFRSDDTKDLKDQIYSFLKEQDTELGVLNNTIEKLAEAILATDHGEKKIAMLGFENENTPFACTAAEDKYAYRLDGLKDSILNSNDEFYPERFRPCTGTRSIGKVLDEH